MADADERICGKTLQEIVMTTVKNIREQKDDCTGADPTPYIWKVYHHRQGYHGLIEILCLERGVDPAPLIKLFDNGVEDVYREYLEFSDLPVTSNSPLPPSMNDNGKYS